MNRREKPEPSSPRTSEMIETNGGMPVARPSTLTARSESGRFGNRSANRSSESVELHIEELVLHGFEPAHRYAIGDAIENELTRLFAEQGVPSSMTENTDIEDLNAGAISMRAGASASTTGVELARAIYGGLRK